MAGTQRAKASNSTVLFQGDSITDAGRSYRNDEILGTGYVMMATSWFSAMHPEIYVRFLNRGISGNRIRELRDRWQRDCLNLKPNVVSVLIGINDAIREFVWSTPTPIERFETDYREILEQTSRALNARIILLEPFALDVGTRARKLREALNPVTEVVRELSREFETLLVPLDEIFAGAARTREPSFWSQDGVHPTLAGHALIAQSWLRVVTNSLTQSTTRM